MKLTQLEGKRILILGYGKEGRSTEKFLKKRLAGAVIDHADVVDGPDYLKKQSKYDIVVRSPGIAPSKVVHNHTTATAIFFANFSFFTIGVTGTKGKSTTASLIAHILRGAGKKVVLAGNIGKPLLEVADGIIPPDTIFVIELSSYQLADLNYSPHVAVVLNLYPEHMDYHGTVEEYQNAKKNIILHQSKGDYFIFHARDPIVSVWKNDTPAKPVLVSEDETLPFETIPLLGEHNRKNIRIAAATARIVGIRDEDIIHAVQSFYPLPHRLEKVGTFNSITFYDDAISTTPESTICALYAIPGIDTLLLGGLDRGYRFEDLVEEIIKKNIRNLVLFPNSGTKILSLLKKSGKKLPNILETRDMREAVLFAYQNTEKGKACVLSTASPSYSVWKNFEEKGNLFQKFVKDLS